jgi:zinc protease
MQRAQPLAVFALAGLLACTGASAGHERHERATPPAAPGFAAAADRVRSLELPNGLTVLVWPDHSIPSVVVYNWVRVGSRNEGTGTTGLAHFFEHMMFNGTAAHPQGEFDRLLEGNGGRNNAFTTQDVTVYQDWLPRAELGQLLELEADRLANLAFDPQVVEKERQVVYSERRLRVEDSNPAALSEQLRATAFLAHPYRIPTIGWPSDIQSWTIDDLRGFYRTWYAPNNCTLVIAGDVDADAVFALVQRYYGGLPRGPVAPTVRTREPEQDGERRIRLARNGQNPLVMEAWPSLAAADGEAPALNLLQMVLTGGEASRLHRALVEEQRVAVDVGSGWSEGFDPNLYEIEATLPEGGDPAAFEKALDVELARVLAQGVSEAELARAKHQVAAQFWRGASTLDGKAHLLGEYAVMHGDWRKLFAAPAAYEAVTTAQVQAVARQVFQPRHRTVGVLEPRAAEAAQAADAAP